MAYGENQRCVKLTEDAVRWVRQQTDMTLQAMADALGVRSQTIWAIRQGRTWKHLL